MKNSTSVQTKGKFRKVKGKIKEAAGSLIGNENLESEGRAEKNAGAVQEKAGQVKRVFEK